MTKDQLYAALWQGLGTMPVGIEPRFAAGLASVMASGNVAAVADYIEPKQAITFAPGPGNTAVAVVEISGVILFDKDYGRGATSTKRVEAEVTAAANDPKVSTIVLNINSPGGTVYGVDDAGAAIAAAAKRKKVVALVNPMCGSAAYWMASQASEIVCIPSADVGSIGVWMMHMDVSEALEKFGVNVSLISAGKYKVEGNPFEPLSDEARAAFQTNVDKIYREFTVAVGRGRGASATEVEAGYGQGRMLMAKDAVAANLADRVVTAAQLPKVLGFRADEVAVMEPQAEAETPKPEAEAETPEPVAEADVETDSESDADMEKKRRMRFIRVERLR